MPIDARPTPDQWRAAARDALALAAAVIGETRAAFGPELDRILTELLGDAAAGRVDALGAKLSALIQAQTENTRQLVELAAELMGREPLDFLSVMQDGLELYARNRERPPGSA